MWLFFFVVVAEPLSPVFYYVRLTNGERGGRGAARAWAWEENQIEVITGSRLTNAIKVKKEWWNGCVYYVSVWIRGEWGSWILIRLLDGREKKTFCRFLLVWLMCEVSRSSPPPPFGLGLFYCDAKIMMPVTVHFLIDVGIFNSCLQAENSIKRPNVEHFLKGHLVTQQKRQMRVFSLSHNYYLFIYLWSHRI